MDKPKSPEVLAFWKAFCAAASVESGDYDVCRMGDGADFGDELLQMTLTGPTPGSRC